MTSNVVNWRSEFEKIDALLANSRQYWQILPFSCLTLPWQDNLILSEALQSLSAESIDRLDVDDEALRQFINPLINMNLNVMSELVTREAPISNVSSRFHAGIKGRKWQQIQKFESLLPHHKLPILEWCAGKGHLGRLVSHHRGADVTSLEWQHTLCEQGQALAQKHQVSQSFVQTNVLEECVNHFFKEDQHALALHACGDLHKTLIEKSVENQVSHLTVVPCCFHLIKEPIYQPLSILARNSQLRLSRQDLNLSMQQTVVAGNRDKMHREIEVSWRLGFDVLQRTLRNDNEYLPLPTIKQSLLSGSFESFCRWALDIKGLDIPNNFDFEYAEKQGKARYIINKRIEIVTHSFRQLLERWLLLDRVIYLQENDYDVELFNFCNKAQTPRNALIQAQKSRR